MLHSPLLIALFNLILLCLAIAVAARTNGVDAWLFACLLAVNAETLVSVVTLNKEIFSLLSVVLFAHVIYAHRRSWLLLGLAFLLALVARWEQVGIMVVFLLLNRPGTFLSRYRKTALVAVTLLLGIAYPLLVDAVNATGFTAQGDTGGTITTLDALQMHFLYPVVVLPKIAMNLFGQLLSPGYFFGAYWDKDFHDLQNQFAVQLHSLAMLILCLWAAFARRIRLGDPVVYFILLYLVITSITPFIQPRYQYPVYVLLCFSVARGKVTPVRANRAFVLQVNLALLPRHALPSLHLLPSALRRKLTFAQSSQVRLPFAFRLLPTRASSAQSRK